MSRSLRRVQRIEKGRVIPARLILKIGKVGANVKSYLAAKADFAQLPVTGILRVEQLLEQLDEIRAGAERDELLSPAVDRMI